MIRLRHLSLIALVLGLTACAESSTAPTVTSTDDDYALVMFGEIGSALEGSLGTQPSTQPVDGRSWFGRLPDSLALTATQRTAIVALRATFRQNNASALDSLRAIFLKARDARRAGGTPEEVRAILATGRPIAEALRPKILSLHLATWSVLTTAQRAWLIANKPVVAPVVGGVVSCQACGCPGSGC